MFNISFSRLHLSKSNHCILFLVILLFVTDSTANAIICKNVKALTADKPLAGQMLKKRATYIVKTDIDLGGKTLFIPTNCRLSFEGGSLKNGTIVGNKTTLSGDVKCYANIKGTFKNKQFSTKWFTKDRNELPKVISEILATNVNEIIVSEGTWFVSETVELRSSVVIRGEEGALIKVDRPKVNKPFSLFKTSGTVLSFDDNYRFTNITIKDLTFDENGSNALGRTSIIYLCNAENVKILNCRFVDYAIDNYAEYVMAAITLYNCRRCLIESCYTEFLRMVSYGFCVNCTARNNKGFNTPGTWLESCDGYGIQYEGNELHENFFAGNSTISQNSRNGIIRNNTIIVNGKEVDSMINIGHPSNKTYHNSGDGCIVERNTIKTEKSKGIIVWGDSKSKGVIIRNNYVYSGTKHAIFVSDAIPSIYIIDNELVGHDKNQVLVLVGAEYNEIRNNKITTSSCGIQYTPIRVRRNDYKGCAIVKGNVIDNGVGPKTGFTDDSYIDLDLNDCRFENNIISNSIKVQSQIRKE